MIELKPATTPIDGVDYLAYGKFFEAGRVVWSVVTWSLDYDGGGAWEDGECRAMRFPIVVYELPSNPQKQPERDAPAE